MDDTACQEAARLLLDTWRSHRRIAAIPPRCRPATRAEGYRVAEALATAGGEAVAGWKIAATSAAGQKHINVEGPLAGRIYAQRLVPPSGAVTLGDNIMKVAEAEFAFRLGRDLTPRAAPYAYAECLAAVDALLLSIEIPDSRYDDFTAVGAAQLIADTACAAWLVVGSPVAFDWRQLDLSAHAVTARRNGVVVAEGTGQAVLGDPRAALAWLVNEAMQYCGGVKAGQFVTTGTCIVPVAIAPGDRIDVDYGVLGRIGCDIV